MNGRTVAGKRQLCNKRIYTMFYKNVKHYAQNAEKTDMEESYKHRHKNNFQKLNPAFVC